MGNIVFVLTGAEGRRQSSIQGLGKVVCSLGWWAAMARQIATQKDGLSLCPRGGGTPTTRHKRIFFLLSKVPVRP